MSKFVVQTFKYKTTMKKPNAIADRLNTPKVEVLKDDQLIKIKGGDMYMQAVRGSNNRLDDGSNG